MGLSNAVLNLLLRDGEHQLYSGDVKLAGYMGAIAQGPQPKPSLRCSLASNSRQVSGCISQIEETQTFRQSPLQAQGNSQSTSL
jgi:hypothetical protein